jgi:hypothetical protein
MSGHLGRSSDLIAKKGNLHSRHHQTAAYSLQLKDLWKVKNDGIR